MQYWSDTKYNRAAQQATVTAGPTPPTMPESKKFGDFNSNAMGTQTVPNGPPKLPKYSHDKRLVINICGARYEVLESTIQRYPNTLLADLEKRAEYWDEERNEYFFDRNRLCFESVLTYYQSGGFLLRPPHVPDILFVRELEFYELGEEVIKTVKGENVIPEPKKALPKNKLQAQIWSLFEYPDTSNSARTIALFSCAIVLLSIVLFCIETLPVFQEKGEDGKTKDHRVFFTIEAVCIAWFTIEYAVRFLSSPNKCRFLIEVLNIIDLVAILPFFISFGLSGQNSNVSSMAVLRAVRLVRVFRIFKLSRYSTGLQILGMTLRASMGELGLLVFFLSVGVVLFSSAVYYAEIDDEDGLFRSIPHSFWWAIVTMTTVGYGDMYPKTFVGKLVGCLCACTGILAIALPVPVIVSNFEHFYSKTQRRESGDTAENKEKIEKRNRLKKFLNVLRRRRPNAKSGEEMYFDMGPYSGMETRAMVPYSRSDIRARYKDQGIQANGPETEDWETDTLRISNV